MVMIYHCAFRRAGKPSKISAGAAWRKGCRIKWRGKPCRFSYRLESETQGGVQGDEESDKESSKDSEREAMYRARIEEGEEGC